MKPFLRWCFVATALTLAGCSNSTWRKSEVLAVPLQPTLQQEVILARMEQILARDRKSTRLNSSHPTLHSFPTRRSSDLMQ